MEFGKHLGKGLWGLAGRALPSLYGVGIILFVIRVFSPVEFGVYTLLQTIFLLAVSAGQSFALQPLVRFAAGAVGLSGPVTASTILYAAFLAPVVIVLSAFGGPLGSLFNSQEAGGLMHYVSLMLLVSIPRNVASYLLQARLELRQLFALDAIYSLGSLALIAVLVTAGKLHTAAGLMQVNLLMLLLSSLYGVVILAGKYSLRFAPSAGWLKQVWDYGRYSLGASASYTLFSQADNLLIAAMLGPVPLAVYNAAKVFTRVFELALQLMTMLLVPTVAKLDAGDRAGDRLALAEKSFLFFTAGLVAVSVALLVAGPFLIDLLYGEKYRISKDVLYILAFSGIFIPGISIGSSYCFGLGMVREVFRVNLAGSILGILLLTLGTAALGVMGTALAAVASYGAMSVLWVTTLRGAAGVPVTVRGVLSRHTDIVNFVRRTISSRRPGNRT